MTPEMLAGLWVGAAYILTKTVEELKNREPSITFPLISILFFTIIGFGSTGIQVVSGTSTIIISSPASAYGALVLFLFSVFLLFLAVVEKPFRIRT